MCTMSEVTQMKKDNLRRALIYALLAAWGVFVLFPFYWMLLTSVKSYGSYNSEYIPKLFTLTPTLQNYADAFRAVPLGRYFLNTFVFTVITTALMLIVTVLAAFAFARLNFRGKNLAGVKQIYCGLCIIAGDEPCTTRRSRDAKDRNVSGHGQAAVLSGRYTEFLDNHGSQGFQNIHGIVFGSFGGTGSDDDQIRSSNGGGEGIADGVRIIWYDRHGDSICAKTF